MTNLGRGNDHMGGRPVGVCRAPPRMPTRDTPTVVLVSGGTPVGNTGRVQTPAVRTSSCCSGVASRSSFLAISLFKAFM